MSEEKIGPGPCPSGPPGDPGVQGIPAVFERDVDITSVTADGRSEVAGILYLDRSRGEIGIRMATGRVFIPLDQVLSLLRRSVL